MIEYNEETKNYFFASKKIFRDPDLLKADRDAVKRFVKSKNKLRAENELREIGIDPETLDKPFYNWKPSVARQKEERYRRLAEKEWNNRNPGVESYTRSWDAIRKMWVDYDRSILSDAQISELIAKQKEREKEIAEAQTMHGIVPFNTISYKRKPAKNYELYQYKGNGIYEILKGAQKELNDREHEAMKPENLARAKLLKEYKARGYWRNLWRALWGTLL